jgi:phosphonate transport system ATP-binding protein
MPLALEGLTRRYGDVVAVDGIDLVIRPGEFVAVIGPSGAGKSTLLRLINRLVEPSCGAIFSDGADVTKLRGAALRRWRSEAPMIFQHFNLAPRLDALTNVLIGRLIDIWAPRSLLRMFTRQERLEALRALDDLGLADRAFERAERLSGGQQQRIAIARALVRNPKYILADEPVASLDPRNSELVMQTLRTINRERGIAVLCNLHQVELAKEYADRVIALRAGKAVFSGRPDALSASQIRSIYEGDRDEEEVFQPRLAVAGA